MLGLPPTRVGPIPVATREPGDQEPGDQEPGDGDGDGPSDGCASLRRPGLALPCHTRDMWTKITGGVLLCLLGGVWFGQGIGRIHGSFMTSQGEWTAIGAVTFVGGLALVASAVMRARRTSRQESS